MTHIHKIRIGLNKLVTLFTCLGTTSSQNNLSSQIFHTTKSIAHYITNCRWQCNAFYTIHIIKSIRYNRNNRIRNYYIYSSYIVFISIKFIQNLSISTYMESFFSNCNTIQVINSIPLFIQIGFLCNRCIHDKLCSTIHIAIPV